MSDTTITLQMIRDRANSQSFQRGEQLYRGDALSRLTRRGDQIEALCEASSQISPYRVSARLSRSGITETTCTCSYDYGGDCKHRVALLLAYLRKPQAFEQLAPIEDTLASRSKEELVALIRQMVSRYPDLQGLIDRPVPRQTGQTQVDTASIRREIRRGLRRFSSYENTDAVATIESIAETAEGFSQRGDWANASAIYRAIIDEVLSDTDIFYEDENGDLGLALEQVVTDLGECMEHLTDESDRRAVFTLWLDYYLADIEVGDYGVDIPDLVLRHAHQPDYGFIRERLQQALRAIKGKPYRSYTEKAYADLLMQIDLLDNVDPEKVMARLREEGQYELLVNKLLELGRAAEAVEVVEKHITSPYQRLIQLDYLAKMGQTAEAIRLAEATLRTQYDNQMVGWLVHQLRTRDDKAGVLEWLRVRMRQQPSRQHYEALMGAVENPAQWQEVHQEVVADLERAGSADILTQIYLSDGEWEKAWKAFESGMFKQSQSTVWRYQQVERELVEATRHVYPERALRFYLQSIDSHIDQRNRDSYAAAAQELLIVRELYRAMDDTDGWQRTWIGIKEAHRRLPALQDEIRKAGL